MAKLLGIVVLCAAVALCGCQMDGDAHTVSSFQTGKRTVVTKTEYSGRYQLYKLPSLAKNALQQAGPPIFSAYLNKGQWLGFKIDPRGQAVAVAGDQSVPLEVGTYEWVMNADPGQYDPVRTTLLVVGIVVAVVAAVAITAAIIVQEETQTLHFQLGYPL